MFVTIVLLFGILIIIINYYVAKIFDIGNLKKKSLLHLKRKGSTVWHIPGPSILPFLGTKWIFFTTYKINKLHEAYEDLNYKYGEIVLEVTPSGTPLVHLFDREDIEKVLKCPSKFPFRPPTEIVALYRKSRPDRYASIGITNEQGESWYNLRSKLTPHITSPKVLQGFLPALNIICDDFVELLKHKRIHETQTVDNFQDVANLMGLEAVCTLILGRRMGFLKKDGDQPETVKILSNAVKQLFISQRDSYFGLGLWKVFPTKTYRDFSRSEEIIYDIISDIVDTALHDEGTEFINSNDDYDLRSVFLKILQTEDLDLREKKSAIVDFIAAGIETLANTLIFTLYCITKNKNATNKICAEFKNAYQQILQDDLSNATFTKACIHEAYRLHPTAFCLARVLEEDITLSGFHLKAGTFILCQNLIACRKEKNFKDAATFKPERWLQNNFNVRNERGSAIIVPFGVGKRTCPGKRFVELELVLLIVKLCHSFDIEFKEELETDFEFLLVPKPPISLILKDKF